jgi:DNA-binding transcriptional MerR regulator
VARIRLIQEMQAEGFNLKAIERLVDSTNGASAELLELQRTMLGSWGQEEPEFATQEELDQRLGGPFDEKTARKAAKLGLVRPLGDGRFEIPSPTLLRAGEELVALGIPVTHALAVAEQIDRHARAIAKSFVKLFRQDVVGDSLERTAGSPEELARLREAIDRLRPVANDALHAGFQLRMSEAVERELQKILEP